MEVTSAGDIVSIEYENSLADIAAFTKYHYTKSKAARRLNYYAILFFAGMEILLTIASPEAFLENPATTIIANLILLAIFTVFIWLILRFGTPLEVKFLYKFGANKGTLGRHLVTLSKDSLIEESDFNKTISKWSSIENIVKTEYHIFIYQSAMTAHVIPTSAFSNETELNNFYETAKRYQSLVNSTI